MNKDIFPYKRYILNAQTDLYKKHLSQAIDVINNALWLNLDWYVAWSGGKDSTVLAHLCNSISPSISIWAEKDDCDFPGELEYVNQITEKYKFNLDISYNNKLWQSIIEDKMQICEDLHSRGMKLSDEFFYKLIEEQEKKYDGVFLGLRNEESKGRTANYRKNGFIYQRKNGKYTCIPLSNWSGTDIFSYLITNKVPILDIYFKTKFVRQPEDIRKAWMLPSARANSGFCVWLKYYYPELFNKLAREFPEVKSYV